MPSDGKPLLRPPCQPRRSGHSSLHPPIMVKACINYAVWVDGGEGEGHGKARWAWVGGGEARGKLRGRLSTHDSEDGRLVWVGAADLGGGGLE